MGRRTELVVAAVNGLLGDHLERTGNGLATELTLFRGGAAVAPEAIAVPGRAVLLVHGLMGTEDVWSMGGAELDFGARLAADLGVEPIYVRYNSGRAITASGRSLADALARLGALPDELILLGHSLGGLVLRAACQVAATEAMPWLAQVRRAIYVGTPHLGSPFERWGRTLTRVLSAIPDPFTRLAADIGDLRSRGIKDLGDLRHPVPLLDGIEHLLIAGSVANPTLAEWFGDPLVPVASATNGAATLRSAHPTHVRVMPGIAHMRLCFDPEVYTHVHDWCVDA